MRSKRWEIPFESFNGVSCRIDIYAEGWVGGITELSTDNPSAPGVPSSNPFYYEEDRSQDVLTPIRSSTGYIGLAEYVSGGLNDLIPQNMFDRYVEVYYGYTLVWVGYIQQKEFSSQFGGNPLVREFPVISPLGLVDEVFFPEYDPPAPISFKNLMKAVATQLNVSYSNVVMPMSGPGLDASMSSLTVCPFNDEHTFAKYNEESVVSPKSLRFFLEGLCNLYGWTLREVGLSMVFTAFNYEGQYMQYAFTPVGMSNRSSIGYYGNSENDIENQFYYADSNAALTAIDAAKSVTYEYDGNTKFEEEHDFNLDTYAASEGIFNPAVYLLPYSQSFGSRYFQLSDSPGVSIVLDNEAKGSINYKYDSSHTVGALLWQGFLKNHDSLGLLYLHLSCDGNEELTNDIELSLQITTAETKDSQPEYYLNRNVANYSWSSSGTQFTVTIDKVTGEIKPDSSQFTSYISIPSTPTPFQNIFVTIFTTANSQLGQRANYKIEMKMAYSFQYTEDGHTYTGDLIFALFPDKFKKVVSLNDEGQEYTLHQNFSDKMMAVEKISPDYDVALISPIVLSETQERLEAKFRMINEYSLVTPETYIEKQEFWQSGWRWRVVSVRFDPRDDEYLVTMHRSPTLESGPSPVPPTPGRLPAGYTELAYISTAEAPGPYIDTGLSSGSSTRILAQYKLADTGFYFPISVRDTATAGSGFGVGVNGSQQFISDYGGNRKTFTSITPNTTDIITVDKNKNVCTITIGNQSGTVTNTSSTFTTSNKLVIFGQNSRGTVSTGPYTFYSFKMWDNDTLVRDLVPAMRDSDNVVGMYDLVSDTFLTNAGTGTFSYGTLENE